MDDKKTHKKEIEKLFRAMEKTVIGHCAATARMAEEAKTKKMPEWQRIEREQQVAGRQALLERYITVEEKDGKVVLTLDLISQPWQLAPGQVPSDWIKDLCTGFEYAGIKNVAVTHQHRRFGDYGNPEKRDAIHAQNPNEKLPDAVSDFPKLVVTVPDTAASVKALKIAGTHVAYNLGARLIDAATTQSQKLMADFKDTEKTL